jgi:hypothetical protein
MHMAVQVMRSIAQLGTLWRHQVGPNGAITWVTLLRGKRHQYQITWKIPVKTGTLRILKWAGYATILKPYGPQLGPTKLGPSWALSLVGPSWAEVGALLAEVDPKWSRRCGVSDRNGPFGRFGADLQNVQITTVPYTFWRPVPGEHAPFV